MFLIPIRRFEALYLNNPVKAPGVFSDALEIEKFCLTKARKE